MHEQLAATLDFHALFTVDDKGITETDRVIKDTDLTDIDENPDNDKEDVTITNTLYYISSADIVPNSQCLHDNILARFSNKQQYAAGQELAKGNFLFLRGNEINSVDKEVLKTSAANGTMIVKSALSSGNE